MNPEPISKLIITYGWQGLCVALLFIVIWLIKDLMRLHEGTAKALTENSDAIRSNGIKHDALLTIINSLRDLLLSRPCIRDRN